MDEPVDKSEWGDGPWQQEPDRVEFEYRGVPCILRRAGGGAWCCYAACEPGHPWHGKHYDEVEADVHGGLTYAEPCNDAVCHAPAPGQPDDMWWLGFDHGHFGDMRPADRALIRKLAAEDPDFPWSGIGGGDYCDVGRARREAESLAEQIVAARLG